MKITNPLCLNDLPKKITLLSSTHSSSATRQPSGSIKDDEKRSENISAKQFQTPNKHNAPLFTISLMKDNPEVNINDNNEKLLKDKIVEIGKQNNEIKLENERMKQKLTTERRQREALRQKLSVFQKSMDNFRNLYSSEKKKKKIILQPKSLRKNRKSIEVINKHNSNISLREKFTSLSTKAKDYRNELQVSKIKRGNLERELKTTRENLIIMGKRKKEVLDRKVLLLQETDERKMKELREKERILSNFC